MAWQKTLGRRKSRMFNPEKHSIENAKEPFVLSRSRIENFWNCSRCFYLDRRLGIDKPPGYPFNINIAVDLLLKKEFDVHRANGEAHPLMSAYKIDAIPFQHPKMDEWRNTFKGVRFVHEPSNFEVMGGVDDIWVNSEGELIIVDYKATSKDAEVSIEAEWQGGYKRQMEIYQWLFRQNGFEVSDTGYFVYCNGRRDKAAFDGKIEFDVKVIPYEGDDSWIEEALIQANNCLSGDLPDWNSECEYCMYRKTAAEDEQTDEQQKLL